MSSGVPTSSIAERARAKWSTGGLQFIHLNMLGTIPWNRGRLGVSSFHVHEVVESIRSDGLSRHRYRDATVVRVPAQHLEEFRKFNRDMCDGDDQLPPFSAEMKYALLTKNHLVHALKLFLCASVHFQSSKEIIKPNPADTQLLRHIEDGVACEVMEDQLWLLDFDGMMGIIGEDNMNAAVDMGINEMEVMQLISSELEALSPTLDHKQRFEACMARVKSHFGSQSFSDADITHLYNFAVRVPRHLCKNLGELHFSLIPPALLRCRPSDFGAVAKIDATHPYCKVALIVSLYLGASGGTGQVRRQVGGVATFCPTVKKEVLKQLGVDVAMKKDIEGFLKIVLRNYKVDMTVVTVKLLLHARARLFYRCGRMLQNWPASSFVVEQELAKIEHKYSNDLMQASAFRAAPEQQFVLKHVVKTVDDRKRKSVPSSSTAGQVEALREQQLVMVTGGDDSQTSVVEDELETPLCIQVQVASRLPADDMVRLDPPAWE